MVVDCLKERNGGGNVAAMHRPHEPKSRNTEQKKGGTQQKAASSMGTVLLFDWNHLFLVIYGIDGSGDSGKKRTVLERRKAGNNRLYKNHNLNHVCLIVVVQFGTPPLHRSISVQDWSGGHGFFPSLLPALWFP